jgi:predicted ATPase/DNA-binding XRE family transcriptional regulator
MEHDASFGFWLARRRRSLRLQRTELAARLGCAVVTLRKIESDERRPSRQIAELLAAQLAIPAQEREIFVRVARGELPVARLSPPGPVAARAPTLAPAATELVGRTTELAELAALLTRPEVRLLTLTGAPGVGKSRLAHELAIRLQEHFADGAALVALGDLSDPALLLMTIAQALTGAGGQGLQRGDQLERYLQPRQLLLVLDDVEHLLPATPHLAGLLRAAPRLTLLVTSRVALEISGEYRFTILPLLTPGSADKPRAALAAAEAQARFPAIDLFVRRARTVNPAFTLADATAPIVGEICRRLDGLPLAIELTAARANLFTPAELLTQLDDRFTLLTSRARDLPERHLSLRHAIGWSYGLLAPAEQRLLRRLSVFVGGCSLEAVQAVCCDDRGADGYAVEGVAALVASSLLQRVEGADGRSRFGMLESVHTYAREQLEAGGEATALRARHAAYYLAMAEAAERAWDRAEEWPLLHRLIAVRANLRAALRWALDTGDAALALRLNGALFSFWASCSALREAQSWIDAALALPRPHPHPELDTVEAKVWVTAGYVAMGLGEYDRAIAAFARGEALYRAADEPRGLAWSLRSRAFIHRLRGEGALAEPLIAASLAACRASGDAQGLAWSLYALGDLRLVQGDRLGAQAALEEALVHLRRQEMPFGVVRALFDLGRIQFEQGDQAGAAARYAAGLTLLREAPPLTLTATGLEGLAAVLIASGRALPAARMLGAAEALRESTGAQRSQLEQRTYAHAVAQAQATANTEALAASWAAGRALSPAQAIAEALDLPSQA